MITLTKQFNAPWEKARQSLSQDLDTLTIATNELIQAQPTTTPWVPMFSNFSNCANVAYSQAIVTTFGPFVFVQVVGTFNITSTNTYTLFTSTLPVVSQYFSVGMAFYQVSLVGTALTLGPSLAIAFNASQVLANGVGQQWLTSIMYTAVP